MPTMQREYPAIFGTMSRVVMGLVLLASFMAFSAFINTVHFSVGSKSSLYFLGMMLIVGYVAAKFDLSRSPEVLNQHQVGSIADQPAVENRLAIW